MKVSIIVLLFAALAVTMLQFASAAPPKPLESLLITALEGTEYDVEEPQDREVRSAEPHHDTTYSPAYTTDVRTDGRTEYTYGR